jgi:type I restriction enzyme R subunit
MTTTHPKFKTDEARVSQIPALQALIKLGYTYLTPEEALTERQGKTSNVLLENILYKQLSKINNIKYKDREYKFSEANIQTAIEKLKNPIYDGLIRTNEEIYNLLTLGTSLEQTIEGDTKSFSLKYIDWNNIYNNTFHISSEFSVQRKSSFEHARPDIVLFVNGIPLVVIECKKPSEDIEQAISQQLRNQGESYIPGLFIYSQLLISTNKNEVKYATTGTPSRFWALWREKEDNENDIKSVLNIPLTLEQNDHLFTGEFKDYKSEYFPEKAWSITEQDRKIYNFCRPKRLLDLIRGFIVYDAGTKKICRYQQYFAIKNTLKHIKNFDENGKRKGGIIWHTQGSGKSLTMVMLARAIISDLEIKEPKIILVTDRVDLDKQLKNTFESCDLQPQRASSGKNLIEILETNKRTIVTTIINKFESALSSRKNYCDESKNIFVLIDESHRSQHGSLHPKMKQIFPNACYLGFTGTPLMKKDKNDALKFGGIIDKYTIDQAVKDGAVVPLLYEGRHVEQEVNKKGIDTWFENITSSLSDEQKADLKRKFSQADELKKTDQTIYCTAFDIFKHYTTNWQGSGFKAQLVAPSKASALKYKEYLDSFPRVSSEVIISAPDQREGYEEHDEESSDAIVRFWNRMVGTNGKYRNEEEYNDTIINKFKHSEEPEILIVVDKLLTGFDAPNNTVLYLTKPLKEHSLLQAIARVNRLCDNEELGTKKDFGYIIDYASVLENLDRALTLYSGLESFDEEDLQGTLNSVYKEIASLPAKLSNVWSLFNSIKNKYDEEEYERLLADKKLREDFYEGLSEFSKTFKIALSSDKFVNETEENKINAYKSDLKRFLNLKAAVKKRYGDEIDYRDYEPQIKKLLDTYVTASEVTILTKPINILDEVALNSELEKLGSERSASKADLIAHNTLKHINEKMQEDPVFYEKFSKLIQEAIDNFRSKRITDLQYLNQVNGFCINVREHQDSDIPKELINNDDAIAFFNLLKKHMGKYLANTSAEDITVLTKSALAFCAIFQDRIIVDWQRNEDIQKLIMNDLDDYLYDVVRDQYNIKLNQEDMNLIIESALELAKHRSKG